VDEPIRFQHSSDSIEIGAAHQEVQISGGANQALVPRSHPHRDGVATDHSVRNLRLVQDTRYPEQPISELFMCVHDSLQDLPLLRMDVENSCHLVLPVPTIPSKLSGRDGW